MTSRRVDMTIPNVPYPTASRGLVLGANGRLQSSALPEDVVLTGDLAGLTPDVSGKVDKDSVVVAATRIVQSKLLAADTQPAFRITGNGRIDWGQGGATAPDTSLYRVGAGDLKAEGNITASGNLTAGLHLVATDHLYWYAGGAYDTSLYRSAAANLKTDGTFWAGQSLVVDSTSGGNKLYFGGALDTYMYRESATVLRASTHLVADSQVQSYRGVSGQIALATIGGAPTAPPVILFGLAADVNLYRSAVDTLKTDTDFHARSIGAQVATAAQIFVGNLGGNATVGFGSSIDTYVYRAGAQQLRIKGSTYGDMMYVQPTNSEGELCLILSGRIGGVEVQRRVFMGAPNSGGSGSRALVIPN